MSKEKFMGRPLQGIEDRGKQKPAEAPFFDGTYRKPQDATSAMVMQKASENGKYQFKSTGRTTETFDDCPEINQKPRGAKSWKGISLGRLKCIGYGYTRKKRGVNIVYWVMRCCCGRYEYRSQVALKRMRKSQHKLGIMCQVCLTGERARRTI